MYTLTIDEHGRDVSTQHDTPEAAQAALHAYLVLSDYYHRPTQLSATHTAFELLSLAEARPRIVGVATIEPYSELDARRDLRDRTIRHAEEHEVGGAGVAELDPALAKPCAHRAADAPTRPDDDHVVDHAQLQFPGDTGLLRV